MYDKGSMNKNSCRVALLGLLCSLAEKIRYKKGGEKRENVKEKRRNKEETTIK